MCYWVLTNALAGVERKFEGSAEWADSAGEVALAPKAVTLPPSP